MGIQTKITSVGGVQGSGTAVHRLGFRHYFLEQQNTKFKTLPVHLQCKGLPHWAVTVKSGLCNYAPRPSNLIYRFRQA